MVEHIIEPCEFCGSCVEYGDKAMDLKPCPFCGGKGELTSMGETTEYWVVWCRTCSCDGPAGLSENEAILLWNSRRIPREIFYTVWS